MDFELHPTISLRSRSFNVLQVPRESENGKEPDHSGGFHSIISKWEKKTVAGSVMKGVWG
jgi:hypothetical protein